MKRDFLKINGWVTQDVFSQRAYSENKRTTVVFVDFESNFIQSIWNKVQNLWVSEDQAVELTGEWED